MKHLSWRLRRAAARLQGERIELRQLLEAHGPGSHGALLMLLAAPCLLPVPGVGNVLGVAIAAVALALWRGREALALPDGVAGRTLPRAWARRILALLARVHEVSARVARPRLGGVLARAGRAPWLPWLVAWMAVLIVLPVPLGNVLPALALMLLGVGLVWLDGLLVVAAWVAAGLATLFPAALVLALWAWMPEAIAGWPFFGA